MTWRTFAQDHFKKCPWNHIEKWQVVRDFYEVMNMDVFKMAADKMNLSSTEGFFVSPA